MQARFDISRHLSDSVVADNTQLRREWTRKVRRFKKGLRLRARVGVLDSWCRRVAAARQASPDNWVMPRWQHDRWTQLLFRGVLEEDYSMELLEGFVQTAEVVLVNPAAVPKVERVMRAVDEIFVQLRRPLFLKYVQWRERDGIGTVEGHRTETRADPDGSGV